MAASVGTLHYVEGTSYKAHKALIAAKFNGVRLDEAKFDPVKDGKRYAEANPTGKAPFLETDKGCIFTSNAIARYVARCRQDTFLLGKAFDHEAQIDTWLEFCTHEVEVPLMAWVYPVLGFMPEDPAATAAAKAEVQRCLQDLEVQLASSKYLVGDFVTLADIAVVCALKEGFERVFDASFRQPYPKVCAWFGSCCAVPQFKAVLGDVKLCVQPQKARAVAAPAKEKPAAAKPAKPDKPAAKPAAPAQPAAPVDKGQADARLEAVGSEIRVLKEKLKAEGLSGKQVNAHEGVQALVAELQKLKEAAADSREPPLSEAQVKAVGDEIRVLKEKLKAEGLSGKKVNEHAEVKSLVAKLQELKAQAA